MPPAARQGDPSGHPGTITGPGVLTVIIGGMPAAVVGTMYTCAFPPPPPHPPNPVAKGSATVFIAGKPAARVGDTTACGAPIIAGEPTVIIGG